MAIFHFSAQIISRVSDKGTLRSAVAAASYRSGETLYSEKDNSYKEYNKNKEAESFLLYPDDSPEWAKNRESLWNEVEKSEKQYNAQLAREINVAIPRELPEEEQKKLVLQFCQKNFVDKGMVADVCIHRLDNQNPHFHVMLTLRRIGSDGKFLPKCKKEYVLDKNGNKIKMPSGEYKSRRVSLTDWDKKETLQNWRKSWQDMSNFYLEKNGFNERISCESYQNQNVLLYPTKHEGVKLWHAEEENQKSDIKKYNRQVKTYNQVVVELETYKQKRADKETEKISRCFTEAEKKQLISTAKELHFYVNIENLEKREKQLKRWEKSIFYHDDSFGKYEKLIQERDKIREATEILKREADRFCDKYYQGWNLSTEEKVILVDKTVVEGRILESPEIDKLLHDSKEKEFRNLTRYLLKNGNTFMLNIIQRINQEERKSIPLLQKTVSLDEVSKLDRTKGVYHIYQYRQGTQCFIGCQSDKNKVLKMTEDISLKEAHTRLKNHITGIQLLVEPDKVIRDEEKISRLENALCVLEKLYDEQLCSKYPDIKVDNLSLPEKEMILHYEEYYGTTYKQNQIMAPIYLTKEKEEIIHYLLQNNVSDIKSKYSKFEDNQAYLNIFVLECMADKNLSNEQKEVVRKLATLEQLPEPKLIPGEFSVHGIIGNLIRGIDNAERKQQAETQNELNRQKAKHKKHRENQSNEQII